MMYKITAKKSLDGETDLQTVVSRSTTQRIMKEAMIKMGMEQSDAEIKTIQVIALVDRGQNLAFENKRTGHVLLFELHDDQSGVLVA